jgi:hypothetical protein
MTSHYTKQLIFDEFVEQLDQIFDNNESEVSRDEMAEILIAVAHHIKGN